MYCDFMLLFNCDGSKLESDIIDSVWFDLIPIHKTTVET
jgi:hypothetical protein